MLLADGWKDYRLIDAAHGEKLEYWGKYCLRRPDPQAIWADRSDAPAWKRADAHYHRSSSGGGHWEYARKLPENWQISYRNLTFNIKPMGFKHTGLFPEQAANWDYMTDVISKQKQPVRLLNLFAYTGGATVAAAAAGAEVVHVDAAKGMVSWAKENAASSGLADCPIRYIVDDVVKFVEREIRRGRSYECIVMDPPSYGRGPKGEVWKFEDELYPLVEKCAKLLSDRALFLMVNSYTTGISPTVVKNVLNLTLTRTRGGRATADELALPIGKTGMVLPCGSTARWQSF
ncbi:MAG: SAM-dependent methyltransferase [Ruminococcaceae bacterium]|nr:SAM-dependent methyltransferase [Oscillospiraceae bacterium]